MEHRESSEMVSEVINTRELVAAKLVVVVVGVVKGMTRGALREDFVIKENIRRKVIYFAIIQVRRKLCSHACEQKQTI